VRPKFAKKLGEHPLAVRQHLVIPESYNAIIEPFERSRPRRVAFSRVLAAVDLHDQPALDAAKIDDVWANRPLALELESAEPTITHVKPHDFLGLGQVSPQRPSVRADLAHNAV